MQAIQTDRAPQAIGTYSQGMRVGNLVYLSGQIPLDPKTQQVIDGDISAQINQVFRNLQALSEAAGGSLAHIAKLTIYLTDLSNFTLVNEIMQEYFRPPYPARAVVEVSQLPKAVQIEIADVVLVLP
ncbi:MAG: Rid family detoxifying hydrolase [Gammaproteobacteria bacterium]